MPDGHHYMSQHVGRLDMGNSVTVGIRNSVRADRGSMEAGEFRRRETDGAGGVERVSTG